MIVLFHGLKIELDVSYDVIPGERGNDDCPSSEPEIEINVVTYEGDDVTDEISEELMEAIKEEINDQCM